MIERLAYAIAMSSWFAVIFEVTTIACAAQFALWLHGRLTRRPAPDVPVDDLASAMGCKPCGGFPGGCTCRVDCGRPACTGDRPTIAFGGWSRADLDYINGRKPMPGRAK